MFVREYRITRDLLLRQGGLLASHSSESSESSKRHFPDIIHDVPLALRLTNPVEANLANDRGACVHVKLRLGIDAKNESKHPVVFYRVYTHHPVADLNELSPRAYFEEAREEAEAYKKWKTSSTFQEKNGASYSSNRDLKNRRTSTESLEYARCEKNDWRPMSAHAVRALTSDERMIAETVFGSRYFEKERNGSSAASSRASVPTTIPSSRQSRRLSGSGCFPRSSPSKGRMTNRGVRTDSFAMRAALRQRARAWSAGREERVRADRESEFFEDDDDDEDVDSLVEWSAGLDLDAFETSWRPEVLRV